MRVDGLASFGPNVVCNLGPVLAVKAYGLQEPHVLVVSPVAITLAPFVLNNVRIG